ncbi:MAG: mandelate racemase/muconate lactonizing enzyme family protein [Caldilineaceae bacterium]|nr:mandelate racemase/muconate lactonizing enzyme family protein [Caldilineaceae bacterium]
MSLKITKIETVTVPEIMPGLLLLRIHTDAGIIGNGETYYVPHAVASMIHDWMARRLLGADPLAVESHWRFLYERTANFGSRGTELRAISAIDLALWDILGQVCEQPVWQLLGGRTQASIPIYNSSGGPSYGGKRTDNSLGWPGYGEVGNEGPYNDYWAMVNKPVDYAKMMLDLGYRGLKTWTLDFAAHKVRGGLYLRPEDLDEALRPLRAIREALGGQVELMLDGHGFFQLAMALRIARALRPLDVLWVEDIIRPDNIATIADFRHKADIPVAVSEMMIGPDDYRMVLEERAADYIMIDPTWVGGISQTHRIAHQAQVYNIPVVMHDCTGPLTMLSGVQVATATANVAWQETVRAHINLLYPQLITEQPVIEAGHILPPQQPGIGTAWLDSLFSGPGLRVSEG